MKPVLGLTMGDPAGIGPELCLRALREPSVLERCVPVLFGDAGVIRRVLPCLASKDPKIPARCVSLGEWEKLEHVNEPLIVDCAAMNGATISPGEISAASGKAGYIFIEQAIRATKAKIAGVVTAPIHKEALRLAG